MWKIIMQQYCTTGSVILHITRKRGERKCKAVPVYFLWHSFPPKGLWWNATNSSHFYRSTKWHYQSHSRGFKANKTVGFLSLFLAEKLLRRNCQRKFGLLCLWCGPLGKFLFLADFFKAPDHACTVSLPEEKDGIHIARLFLWMAFCMETAHHLEFPYGNHKNVF